MDSDRDVCTRAHWFLSCFLKTGTIRRSLSRKVAMRDTSTSRAPSVFVLCQEPSPASSSAQSPPLQRWPEVSLATQTTLSVPQFMNRAIGPVFQQWRALTLGWLLDLVPRWKAHATPSGTLGKAEANGVVCLPDSQTCSVSCGNLVDVAKVFFVVQLLKRVVTSCRNHTGMDLLCADFC